MYRTFPIGPIFGIGIQLVPRTRGGGVFVCCAFYYLFSMHVQLHFSCSMPQKKKEKENHRKEKAATWSMCERTLFGKCNCDETEISKQKKTSLRTEFKNSFADTQRQSTIVDVNGFVHMHVQKQWAFSNEKQKKKNRQQNIMTWEWTGPSLFLWIIRNKILLLFHSMYFCTLLQVVKVLSFYLLLLTWRKLSTKRRHTANVDISVCVRKTSCMSLSYVCRVQFT